MNDIDNIIYSSLASDEAARVKKTETGVTLENEFAQTDEEDWVASERIAVKAVREQLADIRAEVSDLLPEGSNTDDEVLRLMIPELEKTLAAYRAELHGLSDKKVELEFAARYTANASLARGYGDIYALYADRTNPHVAATEFMYEAALTFTTEVERLGIDGYVTMMTDLDASGDEEGESP